MSHKWLEDYGAYLPHLLLSREVEAGRETQTPHRGAVIGSRGFLLTIELSQVYHHLQVAKKKSRCSAVSAGE